MPAQYTLKIVTRFNAARALRHYEGKCANIHGHDFRLEAEINTPAPDEDKGLVVDFYDIKQVMTQVADKFDHQFINEVAPFDVINPTDENLAKWLFEHLQELLTDPNVSVAAVTLWESDEFGVRYSQ
tara:strand:- start:64923 stop:65303 length:381 start_codon:yes stop_codon:yes gene_type:complete